MFVRALWRTNYSRKCQAQFQLTFSKRHFNRCYARSHMGLKLFPQFLQSNFFLLRCCLRMVWSEEMKEKKSFLMLQMLEASVQVAYCTGHINKSIRNHKLIKIAINRTKLMQVERHRKIYTSWRIARNKIKKTLKKSVVEKNQKTRIEFRAMDLNWFVRWLDTVLEWQRHTFYALNATKVI